MLIIALVLALIGLAALVLAVATSNQLVAWWCIGASVLGVVLLIVDALRERQQRRAGDVGEAEDDEETPEAYEQDERDADDSIIDEASQEADTDDAGESAGRRGDDIANRAK